MAKRWRCLCPLHILFFTTFLPYSVSEEFSCIANTDLSLQYISSKTTAQNVELVNSLIVVLQPSSNLLASRHMLLFCLAIIFL